MKVLLIRHPQIFESLNLSQGPRLGLPLGILYIASYIRKIFPEVNLRVLDALIDFDFDIKNPKRDENGFIHFGMTYEEISGVVGDYQPDIIGISNQYTDFISQAIQTARAIKKNNPQIPIVIGGNPATVNPLQMLENKMFDIAVQGEGEFTMAALVEWKNNAKELSEISGIAYRDPKGNVVINTPRDFIDKLDLIPLPAYDLINMESYFRMEEMGFTSRYKFEYPGSERSVSMITSRGCPFQCFFCSIKIHMGQKYRVNSADYVMKHIEFLRKNYNIKHIHFEDDNFTMNKVRFNQILDGLISRKVSLTWDTPNGVRIDTLNSDLIKKMVKTGCIYIITGIESGSQEVNDHLVKKKLDLKIAEKNIKIAFKEGLDTHAFYVIGFPGESKEQIGQTLDFALRLYKEYNVFPRLGIANPIEGTEMFEKAKKAGWLVDSPPDGIRFNFGVERRFKRKSIKTPEFDIEYLNLCMAGFLKKVTRLSLKHTVLLFFKRPIIIWHIGKYYFHLNSTNNISKSEALKQLFLRKLLYTHFLTRYYKQKSSIV